MKFWSLLFLLGVCALPAAHAQSTNLRFTVLGNGVSVTVAEGSSIPIQSDGRDVSTTISMLNAGTSPITINQLNLSGTDFVLIAGPALPLTLPPNASVSANVRYKPVSGRSSVGQVTIGYSEASQTRSLNFSLAGSAPEYAFAIARPDGSRVSVAAGSTIGFPAVRPGSSQTQSLVVSNRGLASGTISSIAVSGSDYANGLPAPVSVPAGQEISIPITFSPKARGLSTGAINLDLGASSASFRLEGAGAAPEFVVAYALRIDGNARPLANGGRLTFTPTPATATATAEVIVANQGNGAGSVRSISLTGLGFQLASLPLLPATIEPGQSLRFLVQFNPRQIGSYSGAIRIEVDDRTISATVEGSTSNPDLLLSYIDPVSRNAIPVPEGTTLSLPGTTLNTTTTYTVVLRNAGEGTGFVNAITVGGEAFQLSDVPALPATILPSGELRFGLRFTPKQRDLQAGVLRFDFPNSSRSVFLSGAGIGPDLMYTSVETDGTAAPLAIGSELSFAAAVGQTISKTVRFTNVGTSEAQLALISVSGAGFQLANAPFLPVTIPISGTQSVTINFTPTQPGTARGRFRIGDHEFDVTGIGIAPRLEFAYTNEAGSTRLRENEAIVLTPARVGESSIVRVSIQNTGTSPIALSTISINPAGPVFAIEGGPSLPFNLEEGRSVEVGVRFTPNNIGTQSATLRVNNTGIPIVGSGQQPVPIPAQRIEGPSGVQPPMQQPAVGLTLAAPYTLPLKGTLALAFVSDVFSDNPAVQFATGGRTVGFTIPANSTRAVFDNGASEVRLQTGTVAGAIQLRTSFSTTAGLDLTPASAGISTITINRAAPRLLTAEVGNRTASSFVLLITGYSTTRSLRNVEVKLTPRGDQRFASASVSVNVESASLVWFQSTQAEALGGLFSMTIPVTLRRGGSTEDLVEHVQGVTVSASNEVGASNAIDATP